MFAAPDLLPSPVESGGEAISKNAPFGAFWIFENGGRAAARPDLDICESAVGGGKGALLVVDIPTHLGHVLRQANYLLGVAEFVVVPHVEHHAFAVGRNDGGL